MLFWDLMTGGFCMELFVISCRNGWGMVHKITHFEHIHGGAKKTAIKYYDYSNLVRNDDTIFEANIIE